MKKIVYVVKNKLHYYPPCVSQIRMLKDLNYDVDVLYGTSNDKIINILKHNGINCIQIPNVSDNNTNKIKKVKNWIDYRKSMTRIFKNYDKNVIFWFGTAESALPLLGKLKYKKYVCFVLELMDEYKLKLHFLGKIMRNAKAVCVCEQTRAYLQKYWWHLKKVPYVFPNKPYKNNDAFSDLKNDQLNIALEKIENSKYILYQGILQNKEELIEIAKALNYTKNHYKLVLMGIDKYKSVKEIKKYYKNLVYIEYIPAPLHLEITKRAHIGIAYYRPDSLNKVFCAPNKIYEYSGFGIPMLCNDVPGLTNTVGNANAAKCINITTENVIKAIDYIDENYEKYKSNAIKFFNSTDNLYTMNELLENLKENDVINK